MKRLKLLLFSAALFSAKDVKPSWIHQNSGSTADLGGVAFTSPTTGNVVGSDGTLLRTTDGGTTWITQTAPPNFVGAYGSSIHFVNSTNGYALGWGRMVKTTDGGANWSTYTNAPHLYYFGLDAWDDNNICVVGQLRTYDSDCYVTKTGLGGFQKVILPGSDANSQFVECQYLTATKLATMDFREMQFSNDGGTTWTKYTATQLTGISTGQAHGNFGMYDFHFVNANVGYMVAKDYGAMNGGNNNISGMIFKTTNGGLNWTLIKDNIKEIDGVKFLDANTGFVFGPNGVIYKTIDGGLNWYGDVIPTANINDMYIVDQNIAYVVCSNGDIWKTTDGGILVPLGVDLELNAFQTPAIITQTANPLYLSILFKNVGGQNINNSSISYQVDGGTPVNGTITFTPTIANSGMVISNHPNSLNASLSLGLHTLKAWINTLNNGTTDMNHNNDTLSMQVKVVASPLKNKKVILEEATGAWCGNCPGGIAVVDYLYDSITASGSNRFIPIAIHNSDAMATVKGDSISSTWDQGAFPMGWVDRKKDINESGVGMSVSKWYPAVLSGLKNDAPVSLNTTVTYNSGNRLVTINCNADFLVNINRELRYHVFILEDSLLSNQVNYLNTVQGSPFFGLGNPIVNYKNKHVLREVITPGGVWGTKIPAASIATGSYTFSLNYTLPNNINETKATVVVFVTYHDADINKREIINADALPVKQSVGIVAFQNNPVLLNAYPNPAYQSISLRIIAEQQSAVTFEIIDLTGKVISQATRPLSNGVNYLELNTAELPEGLYFIKASDGKNNYSGKFTKIHN